MHISVYVQRSASDKLERVVDAGEVDGRRYEPCSGNSITLRRTPLPAELEISAGGGLAGWESIGLSVSLMLCSLGGSWGWVDHYDGVVLGDICV